jgi:hypothetical protein
VRVLQRIFSFPTMLAGLLVLLGVLTVRGRFDDPDLWWHLKMGQIIWTTHSIPANDLFSYTTNHQALIPQEWLSQVVIYCAYLCGGYSGMMLWFCSMTALLLVAGYGLCWLYSGNAKVGFAGALILWFFATIGFSIRPQMMSYILLVAELPLIHAGRTRNPRWFYGLPVVFVIWINCHASFILGIVVAGVYLFSSFFNFEIGSLVARRWDPHCRRTLVGALIVSVVGLFLNPGGIKQILYPFDTLMNMHILMANVQEWAPLQMTEARGIGLMTVVVCCLLLAVMRQSELFLDELLLLAMGTWLAVGHLRMLIVFGMLAAPILSRQLANSWENYEVEEDRIWPNAVMIAVSLLGVFLAFPNRQNLEKQVEAESPVKAVEFIKANHLSGPMMNDYTFGGYLIWAAPEYPVMMDGRTDVYEWSGFLGEFGKWATLQSDPSSLLEKYKVNFCLLTAQSPMIHILPLLHEWKMVYSDDNAVIFVRTPAAGQSDK